MRSQRFPFRVLPDLCLPALSWFPGHRLWLWLLGRATFAGAPEVTGTRAEAGEEEKGLSSL